MDTSRASASLDPAGRRVTVMGLGLFGGGAAVARFFARRGARVTVTDLRGETDLEPAIRALAGVEVQYALGGHREADFTGADLVVANPAVAPKNAFLAAARAAGVPVTSEAALFLEHCPARVAAVTGTQGKSSTCNTLAQLLTHAGIRNHLGGNIGRSLLESAEQMRADEIVVLELSSYQLEVLPARLGPPGRPPRVEIVCVTNVLADHLERHGSVDAYAAAKRRILELAAAHARAGGRGLALLSGEDPRLARWSDPHVERVDVFLAGAGASAAQGDGSPARRLELAGGTFFLDGEALGSVADLALPGLFQRENTLLALGMARLLGAETARLARALPLVRALPHRLEDLGRFAGHRVIDNGVSTTPDSTIGVLGSLAPGFTLLVGGKAKNLPVDELVEASRGRVRRVIAFGAARELFADAYRRAGFEAHSASTIPEAVVTAFQRMEPGEELLFSPACASFDQFLNFQERAQAFRRALPRSPGEELRRSGARRGAEDGL